MTANCLSELTEDGVETKERAEIKPFSVTHQSPQLTFIWNKD